MTSHTPGVPSVVGTLMRQRCSWCGALLLEVDAAEVAPPTELVDGRVVMGIELIPPGAWVQVDTCGDCQGESFEVLDSEHPPDDACIRLDPAVTR